MVPRQSAEFLLLCSRSGQLLSGSSRWLLALCLLWSALPPLIPYPAPRLLQPPHPHCHPVLLSMSPCTRALPRPPLSHHTESTLLIQSLHKLGQGPSSSPLWAPHSLTFLLQPVLTLPSLYTRHYIKRFPQHPPQPSSSSSFLLRPSSWKQHMPGRFHEQDGACRATRPLLPLPRATSPRITGEDPTEGGSTCDLRKPWSQDSDHAQFDPSNRRTRAEAT